MDGGLGTWDYSTKEISDGTGEACGSGGGATSIQINNNRGELKNYNSYSSEVLIVAGGGGGACWDQLGKPGGGVSGSYLGGYQFGQGENASDQGSAGDGRPGGGGGWTGGIAGIDVATSSGGTWIFQDPVSGYGGTAYLSTSLSDSSSITGNTQFLAPNGTYETGHSGNGYARITNVN